ncbi:uncharacterized protein LOC126377251 [Pectinophora gossypiella]|uniref:uncharacterized protein LOC126377251 n=1 Tax=Pectinophora gossypiella TaxID=13191 RepID=UPI00214F3A2F|nr:uncharacterized protein LOC126377251 [Pectinophora gossypiella]XP_049880931.1 uncharacterized protein LOC126377251 [Pectinophora gossypiella]
MSPITRLASVCLLLTLVATAAGIKCWRCGQYSDGVGSITPCANRTAAKLDECPSNAKYCIKYVSELTTVRDCVPTCSEKEWWGARTFCCDTDECNAGHSVTATFLPVALLTVAIAR